MLLPRLTTNLFSFAGQSWCASPVRARALLRHTQSIHQGGNNLQAATDRSVDPPVQGISGFVVALLRKSLMKLLVLPQPHATQGMVET